MEDNMRMIAAVDREGRKKGLSYGQMSAQMREMDLREKEKIREAHEKFLRMRQEQAAEAKREKRRTGGKNGRPKSYDPVKAMELYKMKLSDQEIAERLHTTKRSIQDWRRAEGLARNKSTESPPSS